MLEFEIAKTEEVKTDAPRKLRMSLETDKDGDVCVVATEGKQKQTIVYFKKTGVLCKCCYVNKMGFKVSGDLGEIKTV